MRISEIQKAVHQYSVEKGWWQGTAGIPLENLVATKLALIHSEVSEALEDLRISGGDIKKLSAFLYEHKGPYGSVVDDTKTDADGKLSKPVGFASELADVVIRCFDLAGYLGIDLERVIKEKHEYNLTRAYRHGNKSI
jgi:NTP pyrophosphatase (non-canonical NTP hydrolase)